MEKNQKIALILNIVIFLLASIGCVLCFGEITFVETEELEHGFKLLKFFTVQSNVLAGISALIYLIYFFKGRKVNKSVPIGVHYLRFVATIDLVITFLVVALFLGFITDEGYFSLFVNVNFLFHFAIPVLSFISFVFFENAPKFKFYCTFIGVSHLIWYIIFYLATVLNNYDSGYISIKYDWYAFAQKGLGVALICAVIVFGIGYLTSFILYKYNNRKR